MNISSAEFVKSSARVDQCPAPDKPEFAFIGRSNVGKSSLINMLTSRKSLAKTSVTPGKTQTINHFIINDSWYLVDLPGYGYARVSQKMREQWNTLINYYVKKRENLVSLFVLLDSRHEPIASDLEFMDNLGINQVPFVRVFTKSDKISSAELEKNLAAHNKAMMESWDSLPPAFITSTVKHSGRDELLDYIYDSMKLYNQG
jgi:GTP-binding protein